MAFAYEGALDYEKLKSYPNREIQLLTDTMNAINNRKIAAMEKARSGGGGSVTGPTIGDFGTS